MPSIRPKGPEVERRNTFRPPWVKDGPPPLPAPPPTWMGNRPPINQQSNSQKQEPLVYPNLREVKSDPIKENRNIPSEKSIPIRIEHGSNEISNNSRSNKNELTGQSNQIQQPGKLPGIQQRRLSQQQHQQQSGELTNIRNLKELNRKGSADQPDSRLRRDSREVIIPSTSKNDEFIRKSSIPSQTQSQHERNMANTPPPPPLPPRPPPLPDIQRKPASEAKQQKLEALRSRPRKRPDWSDMMKEVETGLKLKHVQCNDRSAPVIPKVKARGQFVYESEKRNAHNQLLKEIQSGVSLKKVKTNDRSKPILEGLRKFRRQMTIEEQIQKSASVADVIAVATEPDELDDIDKVRDDLQSTKQMLALEMRNKEALERENKRLMARLLNLEAELEKEKLTRKLQVEGSQIVPVRTDEDEKLITKLKEEAQESTRMAKEMEDQYHKTAEELDLTRAKLESSWLRNSQLEMELKSKGKSELVKQRSVKKMSCASLGPIDAATNDLSDSDTETEEGDIDEEEIEVKPGISREERQHNLLLLKIENLKDKRMNSARERKNLKCQLTKLQTMLKEEKKRYRMLQTEVEKMASIMKDVEEGEESEEEIQNEEDDEEELEDDEKESDSSTSSDAESEGSPPPESTLEEKNSFLERKVKNYEAILNRAKKANYLFKANIDRRQDDLNRQKELSIGLQEDLNAVLSELG